MLEHRVLHLRRFDPSRRFLAAHRNIPRGFRGIMSARSARTWHPAMTYVAATITAILTLLYFLMRAGLLGGRSDD